MLPVIYIPFRGPTRASILILDKGEFIGRRPAGNVRIHVPNLAVAFFIGRLKIGPEIAIGSNSVIIDDIVQSLLQGRFDQSFRGIIITDRFIG